MIGNFVAITEHDLQHLIDNPDEIESYLSSLDDDVQIDVDKAWHGIHFILCKNNWSGDLPQFLTVLGGKEIGDDFGYGTGTYLDSKEVEAVSEYLEAIKYSELRKSFNPQEFESAEIYPQGIWIEEKEEAYDYIEEYLKELALFYKKCAKEGKAILKFLS